MNTHAQEVLNAVEVKTLKAVVKTMQGKKLDPDGDQSNQDQSGDQTGRDSLDSVLSDKIRCHVTPSSHHSNRAEPVEAPEAQLFDRVDDVNVETERQVPTIQEVQKTDTVS